MTTAEAQQLEPGDRVQIAHLATSRGSVFKLAHNTVYIRWDGGGFTTYLTDCMQHIRAIPQGTSK
jgi:hypothetical protein